MLIETGCIGAVYATKHAGLTKRSDILSTKGAKSLSTSKTRYSATTSPFWTPFGALVASDQQEQPKKKMFGQISPIDKYSAKNCLAVYRKMLQTASGGLLEKAPKSAHNAAPREASGTTIPR